MNMPGFTAEFTLYKGSECYYQIAPDVVASRNGAGILPALPTEGHSRHSIKKMCQDGNGSFWRDNPDKGAYTWGCIYPDGSGIVCGGKTPAQMNSCETWPA